MKDTMNIASPSGEQGDLAALVGREFVHFKGGHYRLHGFATDTESGELMVVYESLYGENPLPNDFGVTHGGPWVRPAKMFFENVTRDGNTFKRFTLVRQAVVCVVSALLGVSALAGTSLKENIAYAEPERCRLDVKWPVGVTGFPTVVWFHGGGLVGGSKHFIKIDDGIAQVSVNYRLLQDGVLTNGEVCIRDAASAVAWTLENIAAYGGDPRKVYVSGMSAGGYLAMMVGMSPKYLKEKGHDIRELAGLAPVSGQATKHFNVRKFAGDSDPQYLPKIDALAPLAWCSKDVPPIVSICGQEPWEWLCRSEENRLLIASCVALGHKNATFISCPYADHGRAFSAGVPYVEMFVKGMLPPPLKVK